MVKSEWATKWKEDWKKGIKQTELLECVRKRIDEEEEEEEGKDRDIGQLGSTKRRTERPFSKHDS